MNYKKAVFLAEMFLASWSLFSQTVRIDEAIGISARELGQRLNRGGKVAVLNFSSRWAQLSKYVIEELDNALVRENVLTVVDRRELDLVRQEQNFQMSGEVSDESAQRIGRLLGVQAIVSGSFEAIGKTHRFRVRTIAVETGSVVYSNSLTVKKDTVLTALTPPLYGTTSRDYNVVERIGIGLSYSVFGIGAWIYDDDYSEWGPGLTFSSSLSAFLGFFIGGVSAGGVSAGSLNGDWLKGALAGAGIGAGLVGIVGFVRGAFFTHTDKAVEVRVSSVPSWGIDVVADASHNMGLQISYRWQF
ncbi:MAG: CsgG/HfaB family protein [Treponema sp.]|jgi:TolB-like protein|nr:CsgG/HfaB family protein [Treponema sp.]